MIGRLFFDHQRAQTSKFVTSREDSTRGRIRTCNLLVDTAQPWIRRDDYGMRRSIIAASGFSFPPKLATVALNIACGSRPSSSSRCPACSASAIRKDSCVRPFPSRNGWMAFSSARKCAAFPAKVGASRLEVFLLGQVRKQPPHLTVNVLGIAEGAGALGYPHRPNLARPLVDILEQGR
jgi:hypothetical protein